MKFYPCILISRWELYDAGIAQPRFQNGRLVNPEVERPVEDLCGRPVVSIRESTRDDRELLVLIADGYVQYNRISGKRSVVLTGTYDTLKIVLTDIFVEHPDENPYDIFDSYLYQTDISTQYKLKKWVLETYGPSKA